MHSRKEPSSVESSVWQLTILSGTSPTDPICLRRVSAATSPVDDRGAPAVPTWDVVTGRRRAETSGSVWPVASPLRASPRVWGGGIAFYNPDADGEVAARAYLLTFGQLSDVVSQEARRPVGSDLALGNGIAHGGHDAVPMSTRQSCMWRPDGLAMFTITSLQNLEPTAPSEHYLRTMLNGLGEAFGWTAAERVDYLLRAPGVTPAWTPADSSSCATASSERVQPGPARGGLIAPLEYCSPSTQCRPRPDRPDRRGRWRVPGTLLAAFIIRRTVKSLPRCSIRQCGGAQQTILLPAAEDQCTAGTQRDQGGHYLIDAHATAYNIRPFAQAAREKNVHAIPRQDGQSVAARTGVPAARG